MEDTPRPLTVEEKKEAIESRKHRKIAKLQVVYHDLMMEIEETNRKEIDEYAESHTDETAEAITERFTAKMAPTIQELRDELHQLIAREQEAAEDAKQKI